MTDETIRLIVFDWAGTTIDFGCQAPTRAYLQAFNDIGVPLTPADARIQMGLHKKVQIRKILETPAVAQRWQEHLGRPWNDADIEDLYQRVTPLMIDFARRCQLVPGLTDALEDVRRRGIKIATTTGYFREAAEATYEAGRQQGYHPDFSICADEVPAGRPAPWMIFRAMEALAIYPVSAVVKIGDTVADIEEGNNAGTWTAGIVDSSSMMGLEETELAALSDARREERREAVRKQFLDAGADAVIDGYADLPDLIDALNEQMQ